MKKVLLVLLLTAFSLAHAESPPKEIPTAEKAFVDSIHGFDKKQIRAQFGEPAKIEDIRSQSGDLNASIWQYHHLNTNDKGEYYETTELDFVDDKVVTVVFMNNDGTEVPVDAKKSQINDSKI
jgi:hypothetical protein